MKKDMLFHFESFSSLWRIMWVFWETFHIHYYFDRQTFLFKVTQTLSYNLFNLTLDQEPVIRAMYMQVKIS